MMLSCVTHRPWRFSWRSRRFDSGLAAVLLLSASAGLTQKTRALRGRVRGEQGHVLVGAVVQLQSNAIFGFALLSPSAMGSISLRSYPQMSLIAYERLIREDSAGPGSRPDLIPGLRLQSICESICLERSYEK